MHVFTSSQCFWMALTLQNLKLDGNLEFSWYSCNILRYCSNRCIVWFYIPENCPAHANRKFPVQLYVKSKFSLRRYFDMQMSKSPIISGYVSFYETLDGRAAWVKWTEQSTNRLQNSFKIKDNNLYRSSYYWNFRISSFKQVACLILLNCEILYFISSVICLFSAMVFQNIGK